ncbi:MAG: T9SS type A sorting domain-containing protein [Prevotella sp.]|jgi:hypothetical protein|nr:T9SS type A sorting domain-containing protein [Prevotella sp.]
MRKFMLLLLFIVGNTAQHIAAQDGETVLPPSKTWAAELPDNPLPSDVAAQEMETMAALPDNQDVKGGRNLRYAPPDEDGWANKEIWAPLGNADIWMALVAMLAYILFRKLKTKNKKSTMNAKATHTKLSLAPTYKRRATRHEGEETAPNNGLTVRWGFCNAGMMQAEPASIMQTRPEPRLNKAFCNAGTMQAEPASITQTRPEPRLNKVFCNAGTMQAEPASITQTRPELRLNKAFCNAGTMQAEPASIMQTRPEPRLNTRKKIANLLILLLLFCALPAHATIITATDNFFVATDDEWTETALDVLANDYYGDDCLLPELIVKIKTDPVLGGYAYYDIYARAVMYAPGVTHGEDSLTYTVRCPDMTDEQAIECKVYIHIKDKPGMISDATCFVNPSAINFVISEKARTAYSTYPLDHLYSPIFGDIDNDGNVEILAYQSSSGNYGNDNYLRIFNYNGSALSLKYSISVSNVSNGQQMWANENTLIAKITGTDGASAGLTNYFSTASIFICFHYASTLKRYDLVNGVYTQTWSVATGTNGNAQYNLYSPFIADLMGDGHQQIICADRVYNADTGQLLMVATNASGTALVQASNTDQSFGRLGHYANTSPARWYCAPIAVDVDGDNIQEIIGGNCVYKIHIGDYTSQNTTENTYRLWRKANYKSDMTTTWSSTFTKVGDGATAVADMDLDGQLDVIVTSKGVMPLGSVSYCGIFIYNPRTGQMLHDNQIYDIPSAGAYGVGRPFVGDIDADGQPEACVAGNAMLDAYELDIAGRSISRLWRLTTADTSASTGLSLFDFDQSGTGRMVYRDISTLRIIRSVNGSPVTDASISNNSSDTANEYPVVGDLNGDGHAEIATISYQSGQNGSMRIYASGDTEKWAPARKVWHQGSYNPTFINDDLTVPRYPLSPATKFVAPDGTVTRTFNNFLQQNTVTSSIGQPSIEAADIAFKPGSPKRFEIQAGGSGDEMLVTFTITNRGVAPFCFTSSSGLRMYAYDAVSGNFTPFGSEVFLNPVCLDPGADYSATVNVGAFPASYDGLAGTINLSSGMTAAAVFEGQSECQGLNNRAMRFSLLTGHTILCEGETGEVSVNEAGKYDVYWFTDGNSPAVNSTPSDTYTFGPKNSDPISYMLAKAKDKATGSWISPLLDTIYIYHAIDTLVWNNRKANGDWNDYENWTNPNDPNNNYPQINVPMPCTNVLLPSATATMTAYPDLSAANTTTLAFGPLGNTVANKVYFNFGAEVVRPDRLTYDSAFVKMKLEAHRWYMLAPPLKQMYAGDFYRDSPIPISDAFKSYTRLWNAALPNGLFFESAWTKLFSEPNLSFTKGQGLAVWLSSNDDVTRTYELSFPKWDAAHHIYYENTTTVNTYYPAFTTPRNEAFRFVFDGDGADGADFDLSAEAKTATSLVMVANPFMAHLDFDLFYAANSSKIQNRYRVMDATGSFKYYQIGAGTNDLTKNIAPMQAFIVEAKTPFTTLTASGLMTVSVPGASHTLKSAAAADGDGKQPVYLTVSARQGARNARTYLKLSGDYSAAYQAEEDVAGLYEMDGVGKEALEIYSVSSDGLKLNLNCLPSAYVSEGGLIPLGIRTASPEKIIINVSNLPALLEDGNKVYLHDAKTRTDYDLSNVSMYSFEVAETDGNNFADNRFYLKIVKGGESVQSQAGDNSLSVVCRHGQLAIQSVDAIEDIAVYDPQGRLICGAQPNSATYRTALAVGKLYVVKVKVNGRVYVRKVIG